MAARKGKLVEIVEKMKKDIASGARAEPITVTIRELINWYGYEKRGEQINKIIRNDLDELKLYTEPPFENDFIDSEIEIKLGSNLDDAQQPRRSGDPVLRVGSLKAAHKEVTYVQQSDAVKIAFTKMVYNDFSRLPVMSNDNMRDIRGIISWKSIAESFFLGKSPERVGECMESPEIVSISTPLVDAIHIIEKHEYVLVQEKNKEIVGIVTAADVSKEFVMQTHHFLLIGEIEWYLRDLISGKFTVKELRDWSITADEKTIEGPSNLTLGSYCRLLEHDENWNRLGLNMIERKQFVEHLNGVREIRNDIMHFNPDGCPPEDIDMLENFAIFLKKLV